ncbi:MAG: putative rane protein [Hyphomicrobiales bacterium]|nr:putative rane protein [Hyphomicrobiales bacterium]
MSGLAHEQRGGWLRRLHALALRTRVLRAFVIRPRLLVGIAAGLVIGLATPVDWRLTTRLLFAWNGGVLLYIGLTIAMMLRDDLDRMRQRVSVEDEGRFVILALCIFASVASIAAIVAQLAATKDLHGAQKALHIVLAGMTIATGWTFIHLTFALHYAHEYASEQRRRPKVDEKMRGGLQFPDTTAPDYSDFLYFSFIIGVACQTADVAISSPMMRSIALAHGVVAFVYNTTIVALMINIAAGLI